jgi:hypothetical protein
MARLHDYAIPRSAPQKLELYTPFIAINPSELPTEVDTLLAPKSKRMQAATLQVLKHVLSNKVIIQRPMDIAKDFAQTDANFTTLLTALGADTILELIMKTMEYNDPIQLDCFLRESARPISLQPYGKVNKGINFLGSLDEYATIHGVDHQSFGIGLAMPGSVLSLETNNPIEKLNRKIVVTHNESIAKLFLYKLSRQYGIQNMLKICTVPSTAGFDKSSFIQNLIKENTQVKYLIILEERDGGTEEYTKNFIQYPNYGEQAACVDITASGNSMKKAGLILQVLAPIQSFVAMTNTKSKLDFKPLLTPQFVQSGNLN